MCGVTPIWLYRDPLTLTKILKLRERTNLYLILLTIQPNENLKNILSFTNLLLTQDADHRQVFAEVTKFGFKRMKNY